MRSLYDSRLNPQLKAILRQIQKLQLDGAETALVRAVDEEFEALLKIPPTKRRTQAVKDEAWQMACETYARLIRLYLKCPEYKQSLSPDDVLSFRCKANAWAIAAKMRDAAQAQEVELEVP